MSRRPCPDSQEGRILALLEAAKGGKVSLPEILALRPRISQYGRAIHTLRHKYGMHIENVRDPGQTDHTFFRLVATSVGRPVIQVSPGPASDACTTLFPASELERTSRWEDHG